MKLIIKIALFLVLLGVVYAKPSRTIMGDCNSSDSKDHYVSKTYHDADNDGKYEHVTTRDCNNKTTTEPYFEPDPDSLGKDFDPGDYDHFLVTDEVNESGQHKIVWHLKDATTGTLVIIEAKDFNDTEIVAEVIP